MEEFALTFTRAAAHFLWAGAAVALLIFSLDRLFVRSAAVRHGLYLAGMLAMAASLALCFAASGADSAEPVMEVGSEPGLGQRLEVPDEPSELSESGTPPAVFVEGVEAEARTEKTARQAVFQDAVADRWQAAAPWVVGIYFTGLSLMILRLGSGWSAGARLRRRSELVREGVWMVTVRRAGEAIGLRVLPALRWSREVAVPVVVGFAKPAILLPVALASRLSVEQVEAVLAHELAHLRRRDLWAVAVQRAMETVLFFHPAVWWMSRVMERAREEACDDLVVATGSDPADYAEALLICSEYRLERDGVLARLAWHLAATGGNEAPLRQRVLRLLGQEKGESVRLGRAGWVLAAFVIGGIALALAAGNAGRDDLSDFDFDEPPTGYEKGVKVADRNQSIELDGVQFRAGEWKRDEEGRLMLDLGVAEGYEIIEIRLFDHATRRHLHSSTYKGFEIVSARSVDHDGREHVHSLQKGKSSRLITGRVGATNWLRIREMDRKLPDKVDVWLRVVTNAPSRTMHLPARAGASTGVGDAKIVLESLFEGRMSGRSDPSGKMRWDLDSAELKDRVTTVNLSSVGALPRSRYHVVAVEKDGTRHPMHHIHFFDFSLHGSHVSVVLDVAKKDVDHLEIVPFGERHKFFFNGLKVPRVEPPDLERHQSASIAGAAPPDGGNYLNVALLTLPESYLADIPLENRDRLLMKLSGWARSADHLNYEHGWVHWFYDGPAGDSPGATSMFWMKILPRGKKDPLVFVHMSKPFSSGRAPAEDQTFVLERGHLGQWKDVTKSVIPADVDRTMHFRPRRETNVIEVLAYENFERRDGRGQAFRFGEHKLDLIWNGNEFQVQEPDSQKLSTVDGPRASE